MLLRKRGQSTDAMARIERSRGLNLSLAGFELATDSAYCGGSIDCVSMESRRTK